MRSENGDLPMSQKKKKPPFPEAFQVRAVGFEPTTPTV